MTICRLCNTILLQGPGTHFLNCWPCQNEIYKTLEELRVEYRKFGLHIIKLGTFYTLQHRKGYIINKYYNLRGLKTELERRKKQHEYYERRKK